MTLTATFKRVTLLTSIASVALLLGACGATNEKASSGDVRVKIYEPLTGCTSPNELSRSLPPKDGGGGDGGPPRYLSSTCTGVVVEVSGTNFTASSVVVDIDGNEFSTDVSPNGSFNLLVSLASVAHSGDVAVTPLGLTGIPGAALVVDSSSFTVSAPY